MAFYDNLIPPATSFYNPRKPTPLVPPTGESPFMGLLSRIKNIFTPQQAPQTPQIPQAPRTTMVGDMFKNFQTTNIGGFTIPSLTQTPAQPQQQFTPSAIPQVLPSVSTSSSPPAQQQIQQQIVPPPIIPQNQPASTTGIPPVAPQVAQGGEKPPETPIIPSATEKAITDAETAYQAALKISPEEISTQADLDKLLESTKKAYQNALDQPIPLEFITGQMASLERRALGLAEPLDRKLAKLQAARTSALEASKFGLERADKAREALKPVAGTSFYDPKTGKFISTEQKAPSTLETDQGIKQWDPSTGTWKSTGFKKAPSATAEEKAVEKTEAKARGKSDALNNYALVNEILSFPDLNAITGIPGPSAFLPGTALVRNQMKQLNALLSLDNRQKLKGSGAISDFEAKTLEAASSSLGINQSGRSNLSNEALPIVLKAIRGVFATAGGMEANVKVTSPTGETIISIASREEIDQLIAEGNKIEYQ